MTAADLTEQLRASPPGAPDTLRERVRAIAAANPAPAAFPRLRSPRLRLVVPVVAATAVAAAGLIALVRPEHQQTHVFAATEGTRHSAVRQGAPPTTTTQVF